MKTRKERVLEFVKEHTKINLDKIIIEGVTTDDVSKMLSIDRTGASRVLNALINEEAIIKVKSKPVLYFADSKLNIKGRHVYPSKEELFSDFFGNGKDNGLENKSREIHSSVFESYIGSKESLKYQVNQAKAAILYPPNGLHTLICGPTGVGKTTFARLMFDYGVEMERFSKHAPYVVFNCADYAGNSQLLISLLFGYTKGAFTGATEEKKGLVDQANGGVLFLDEIHRLPPEGQEMLFSLIDRGIFRRLGETSISHESKIMIIGATTENLSETILKTFIRRIPNVISIPGLSKRTIYERYVLIDTFFAKESQKINAFIHVSSDVIQFLLTYDCSGNIGQLKSDIQMICANAFADYVINNLKKVNIGLNCLPNHYDHLVDEIKSKNKKILNNIKEDLIINELIYKNGEKINQNELYSKTPLEQPHLFMEQHFYKNLLKKYESFFSQGVSVDVIKERMKGELEHFFNVQLLGKKEMDKQALTKIISPKVLHTVEKVFNSLQDFFPGYNKTVVYNVAMHIESVINRIQSGSYHGRSNIKIDNEQEHKVAAIIKQCIDKNLGFKLPFQEAVFLAMFITSIKEAKQQHQNIGILVLAHGDSTASSMAQVANEILHVNHARALDMALNDNVDRVLRQAAGLVREINCGKGVLLLVDMGSLTNFADAIFKMTQIPTKMIKMVSTPIVIEATRKSLFPAMTLSQLVNEVERASEYIGNSYDIKKVYNARDLNRENDETLSIAKEKLIRTLGSTLVFLDAHKAYDVLNEVLCYIVDQLGIQLHEDLIYKFQFHCMSMLERALRKEPLIYKRIETIKKENALLFKIVEDGLQLAEDTFGFEIADTEIAYLVDMLQPYLENEQRA
ncbi:sigma-54-dependent transcriptional regulator [Sporolactobacillus sp. KGMB 08714]|uniref:sigma-54-dependent transcriptional regulator n=1 Tax=Sporolactobacillus sp. KGMB 08714 TaxID=3064704 RepID=UPI002FBD483E